MGGLYGVLATGLDIIIGVSNIADFAQGEILMLAMYTTFFLNTIFHINIFLSLVVVPIIFIFIGLLLFLGIYARIIGKLTSTQIMYTGAFSLVLQNVALVAWTSDPRQISNPYRMEALVLGPFFLNKALLIDFFLSIIITVAVYLFLYKTERGTLIRATANNPELISLLGLDPNKIYLQAYCLGVMLTSLGGALLSIYYPMSPVVGSFYILIMFISMAIGGAGSIKGCWVGGMIIGITQVLASTLLPINFQNIVFLIIFMLFVAFMPEGIFGRR